MTMITMPTPRRLPVLESHPHDTTTQPTLLLDPSRFDSSDSTLIVTHSPNTDRPGWRESDSVVPAISLPTASDNHPSWAITMTTTMATTMTTTLCLPCNNEENNRILFQSLSSLLLTKTKKKKSNNLKKKETATETEIVSDLVNIPKKKRDYSRRVRKKCSTQGCSTIAVQGGKCISHGAIRKQRVIRIYSNQGCPNQVVNGGKCVSHGAKRKRTIRKNCSTQGCSNIVVQGGKCVSHGAIKKKTSDEKMFHPRMFQYCRPRW